MRGTRLCLSFAAAVLTLCVFSQDGDSGDSEPDAGFAFCGGDVVADYAELEAELDRLTVLYPDFVRTRELGTSPGGARLWALEVTLTEAGEHSLKPAVFLAPRLDGGDLLASSLVAGALCRLADRAANDPQVAMLLREMAFVGVPCADPDAADSNSEREPGRIRLNRNFPTGWDPWALSAAGPYPLVRPEGRALAGYLAGMHGLTIVLDVDFAPEPSASAPMAPIRPGGSEPGSLSAFARTELGAWVFRIAQRSPATAGERAASIQELAQELYELARRMPRAAIEEPVVLQLGQGLWQVDLVVANSGSLPTYGVSEADAEHPAGSVRLAVDGVRVVGAALRRSAMLDYEVIPATGAALDLGNLDGAERLRVRLVLAAPAGAQVSVTLGAPRASPVELAFTLE